MSTAIYGVYDFDAWDITHEFMIYETLSNIQNKFRSADNAFTSLERKCHEISGEFKPGKEETKLYDHIVRIIVLLKRWLLQIEQGYCMGTERIENTLTSNDLVTKNHILLN